MNKLEEQLTKEKLHENDSKTDLTALKAPFEKIFNFEFRKFLTFKTREDFKKYKGMEAQIFKDIMICDMDFIKKYMIETILYEQEIQKLLNEKKLQTQEVQTNTIKAVDASSVTQNECCRIRDDINESSMSRNECNYSRNESSILETAYNLVKENITDSETKDVHAIKYKMSKSKERCMTYFRSLHSHLHVLSKEDLKGTRIEHGFKWGQDDESFISTMFLNMDQLKNKLDKDEFQEDGSMDSFCVINR
ncbi:hypothetical protein Tco_1317833 [Tanacetum coccineum]